jgi:hypothetical protein
MTLKCFIRLAFVHNYPTFLKFIQDDGTRNIKFVTILINFKNKHSCEISSTLLKVLFTKSIWASFLF